MVLEHEIVTSPSQVSMNRVLARAGRLPFWLAQAAIGTAAEEHGQTKIFNQLRVGQFGQLFQVHKIRTLDGDTPRPLSPMAARFRKYGLDELGQLDNINDGTMRMFGWRPLTPGEHEEFLGSLDTRLQQQWVRTVLPTKPGVLSTYGVEFHTGIPEDTNKWVEKAESDIKDVVDGSALHSVGLVTGLARAALGGQLQQV